MDKFRSSPQNGMPVQFRMNSANCKPDNAMEETHVDLRKL